MMVMAIEQRENSMELFCLCTDWAVVSSIEVCTASMTAALPSMVTAMVIVMAMVLVMVLAGCFGVNDSGGDGNDGVGDGDGVPR